MPATMSLSQICDAIVEVARAAEPIGAPGGHIYAALATTGMRLDQYEQIMAGLVSAGKLRRDGDCYHAT